MISQKSLVHECAFHVCRAVKYNVIPLKQLVPSDVYEVFESYCKHGLYIEEYRACVREFDDRIEQQRLEKKKKKEMKEEMKNMMKKSSGLISNLLSRKQ